MHHQLARTFALLVLACYLLACAAPLPLAQTTAAPTQRWIVRDSAELLAMLPSEMPDLAPPPAVDAGTLAAWREPPSAWMRHALRAIQADSQLPPHAARSMMLLAVALNDALQSAEDVRASGHAVADDAVLAAVAERMLSALFPLRADAARADAQVAAWVGFWRGDDSAEAVLRGQQLGALVSDAVLAWAAADGSQYAQIDFVPPSGAGFWQPTAPSFASPDLVGWGNVATVALADAALFDAPAPPAWDDETFVASREQFVALQGQLDDADRALARHWAAGMGTVTPPGMWIQIALDLVAREQVPTRKSAAIYAALGVALHDVAVACWHSKYAYVVARPIQWMAGIDPAWKPLLVTPAHPSYPSGHAAFSGAASAVLAAFFPNDAAALAAQAEEAAHSRIVGGIHWSIDGSGGLAQGRAVAAVVVDRVTR
jgi:membrane-associated phospholipid phosphatase